MYDYFLFDLDNCLLHIPNPSDYFDNILLKTLKKLSIKSTLPNRKERNSFWLSGENYLNLLKKWGITDSQYFWKYFDEIDFQYRKQLFDNGEIYIYNDVMKTLKELRNMNKKIGLVSNTADYIVDYFLEKLNISLFFDETLGLGFDKDQSIAKPSPKGIIFVLNSLNFNPKNSKAIMIGDSRVDIFAAKRANITACLLKRDEYKYPNRNDWESFPDYEIDSLNELFRILD
ncbi:MAG: HAD family hydrolase [Promethearchaeota archaeon]